MKTQLAKAAAAACLAAAASPASAETFYYAADLVDLSAGSSTADFGNPSGLASIAYDDEAMTLSVRLRAFGMASDITHVQHIHGLVGGDSRTPTLADDTDGDGFIELLEGAPAYGPIMLSLRDDTIDGLGGFPTAPGGTIDFSYTYDLLTTSAYGGGFGIADLMPAMLEMREIVVHGAFTMFEPENSIPGLGGGILDDGAGNPIVASGLTYNPALPVLAGEIRRVDGPAPIPLPAAGWMLVGALAGLGAMRRRK